MFSKFIWIIIEKGGNVILNFATIIILGRLISPSDYGIYGILYLFISVIETLIDSGFGGALVQKRQLIEEDLNTLFFFNLSVSIIAYLLLFFLAPQIESFYQIENLALYFRVIGLTLILYALSIVQTSLFNRNLLFQKSATINLVAYFVSALLAVVLAYRGWGIWALISQLLCSSLLLAVFYWISNNIKLSLKFSKESFLYMWRFGINTVIANVLQSATNNVITSILPKIANETQAGLFFQANRINNVPSSLMTQCIDKGVFPVLSKVSEDSIVESARKLNRTFISIIIPVFPLFSLISYLIVTILLGDSWKHSSVFLSILLWGGVGLSIQVLYRNLVKSTGRTKYIFYVEVVKSVVTLLILLITMKFGAIFMVYGFTISTYLGVIFWAIVLNNSFSYSIKLQVRDFYKPFLAMTIMMMIIKFVNIDYTQYYSLLVLPIGYILYWILSVFMRNNEIRELTKRFYFSMLGRL